VGGVEDVFTDEDGACGQAVGGVTLYLVVEGAFGGSHSGVGGRFGARF
jgi:hypothetical protein